MPPVPAEVAGRGVCGAASGVLAFAGGACAPAGRGGCFPDALGSAAGCPAGSGPSDGPALGVAFVAGAPFPGGAGVDGFAAGGFGKLCCGCGGGGCCCCFGCGVGCCFGRASLAIGADPAAVGCGAFVFEAGGDAASAVAGRGAVCCADCGAFGAAAPAPGVGPVGRLAVCGA